MNRTATNQGPQLSMTPKVSVNGKIECALDSLSQRVDHLHELTEELVNLIQHPRPVQCGVCAEPMEHEPTLSQSINRIDARADDVINNLALAVDIIRQNLGSIKLD